MSNMKNDFNIVPPEIAELVITGVQRGLYAVLLGAGFATCAKSLNGHHLPTSRELAEELSKEFDIPAGHTLSRLWQTLPQGEREKYLQVRFRNCVVPSGLRALGRFVWRSIYTFNVDDVVETIYETGDCQQSLHLKTFRDYYSTVASPAEVNCIHIHGSVLNPDDGYVFSTPDYAELTARPNVWPQILADELAESPMLIIGCSLDEYDIEHYLAARGSIDAPKTVLPSLFVTTNIDHVTRKTAERFGFVAVQLSTERFLRWLENNVTPVLSPLELVEPHDVSRLFRHVPSEPDARIFYRQFIYVKENELPLPITDESFLCGLEPTWSDITNKRDVIRRDIAVLIDKVKDYSEELSEPCKIILIEAPPGSGKSTVLMRTAFELSQLGYPVFYFRNDERLASRSVAHCLRRMKTPPVLVVDQFSDNADQLAQLENELTESDDKVVVLAADRTNMPRRARISITQLAPDIVNLQRLTTQEASQLVRRMRREGLLGRSAAKSDNELRDLAMGEDMLVAFCEIAGNQGRFDALVKSHWSSMTDDASRKMLAAVSIAHSFGYRLRLAIATKCAATSVGVLLQELRVGCLKGLIYREEREYLRSAHRVIAEKLISAAMSKREVFDALVSLSGALAPYVSRDSTKRMTQEARIAGKLLDYDASLEKWLGRKKTREFYDRIKQDWDWSSRYWEQVALLELQLGNYAKAITHAKHAVGIEEHVFTFTTLGHVLLTAASKTNDEGKAQKCFDEGVESFKQAHQIARARGYYFHIKMFHAAIRGVIKFCKCWETRPSDDVYLWISSLLNEATDLFPKTDLWLDLATKWDQVKRLREE